MNFAFVVLLENDFVLVEENGILGSRFLGGDIQLLRMMFGPHLKAVGILFEWAVR